VSPSHRRPISVSCIILSLHSATSNPSSWKTVIKWFANWHHATLFLPLTVRSGICFTRCIPTKHCAISKLTGPTCRGSGPCCRSNYGACMKPVCVRQYTGFVLRFPHYTSDVKRRHHWTLLCNHFAVAIAIEIHVTSKLQSIQRSTTNACMGLNCLHTGFEHRPGKCILHFGDNV
jgi:hypothetical protein